MANPAKVLSANLRRSGGLLLRRHRWLLPAGSIAIGVTLVIAIVLQADYRLTLLAAACFFTTSYMWGYFERVLESFPWPSLHVFTRSQYAETWNAMAESLEKARIAACGYSDERDVRASAAEPVRNLIELVSITDQDNVLEIACGIARVGRELAACCRSWTGADTSANMLHYAGQRLQGIPNVHLRQLTHEGLPVLGNAVFDVVYST